MKEGRLAWIDILKGFGIICVIIGHYSHNNLIRTIIWSFHMPLFVIISGYLFKKRNLREYITKGIRNYLFPYLLTWIVVTGVIMIPVILGITPSDIAHFFVIRFYILLCGFASNGGVINRPPSITRIGVTWFLLALFQGEMFYVITCKFKQRIKVVTYIVLSILGGAILFYSWIPLGIAYGFAFLPWLFIGDSEEGLKEYWEKYYLVTGIIWFICVCIEYKFSFMFDINRLDYLFDKPVLYLIGFIGALNAFFFLRKIVDVFSKMENFQKVKRFLMYLGKNTIWILCVHAVDVELDIENMFINRGITWNGLFSIVRFLIDIVIAISIKQIFLLIKKTKAVY